MRECPVNERCLARDSCSRICDLRSKMTSASPPNAYKNNVVIPVSLGLSSRQRTLLQANDTEMTAKDDLNFLLTNRIPRRLLTQFMGWLSRIEQPLVCRAGIALWRLFTDLDLGEAKQTRFK